MEQSTLTDTPCDDGVEKTNAMLVFSHKISIWLIALSPIASRGGLQSFTDSYILTVLGRMVGINAVQTSSDDKCFLG